jgi:hypothetical protein
MSSCESSGGDSRSPSATGSSSGNGSDNDDIFGEIFRDDEEQRAGRFSPASACSVDEDEGLSETVTKLYPGEVFFLSTLL